MRDTMLHRGPDDEGLFIAGNIGLGHRRLSIIDVAGGHQPMANADETIWITYNGEMYNFLELRARLESRGYVFRSKSDTEVILHAYDAFGEDCVDHFRGMFAFAIWDSRRQKLFLARDRLGIKPLYYALHNGTFLFASEIKAILAGAVIRPTLNEAILPEFLATRFVSGDETFFRGIRKLLPGRTLSWSVAEGFQERRYWRLPVGTDTSAATLEERGREVRARLASTVRNHLMTDVPLGLFLSGGLDSSGLAALMTAAVREPIRTFAVGFSDREANELAYARLAARAVGAEHREVVVSPEEFFDALPRLIWHEDEPIAFTSSVPLYFVSRLAAEHVKVVLTGEGADELFLGYNRYRVTAWNDRLGRAYSAVVPRRLRGCVKRLLPHLPRPASRYAQRTFLAREPGPRDLFFENFAVFPRALQQELIADEALRDARDPYSDGLRSWEEAAGEPLDRMSHADLQTYLVELLMKQDQMSMAASVESRVPFLDHEFVEHVIAIPTRFKLHGWQTKAVLRAALRDAVPPAILRRRKMGFPVPIGRWFQGPFWPVVEQFVLDPRALQRGLFEPATLRRLAEEHRRGARDHGDRLWLLANLEIWQRIFLDGEDIGAITRSRSPRRQGHAGTRAAWDAARLGSGGPRT